MRLDTNFEASVGMAAAVQGNYRAVAWVDHSGPGSRVVLRESQDHGATWGPAQVMGEGICYDPRLAVRGEAAYLVWEETEVIEGQPRGLIMFRKNDTAVGIGWSEVVELPEGITLTCYPNPFNAATTITGEAEIAIFDITGRRVATLHAAKGRAVWEPKNLSSGVYYARAVAGEGPGWAAQAIKLVYLK
jgi:hypothetical protein